jgi:murein DD-endopeptidase MepM/ murein hydrolase activator NlpD
MSPTLRVALVAHLAVASIAAGAALGDPGAEKQKIDARLKDVQGAIDRTKERESVLTSELTVIVGKLRAAQDSVSSAVARLDELTRRLDRQRIELGRLDRTIREQTERIAMLNGQHAIAVARLEQRVREIYMTDSPDVVALLVGARSFNEVIDNLNVLERVGRQDKEIVGDVATSRARMQQARRQTRDLREQARLTADAIARDTEEQRTTTEGLVAQRDALAAAEAERNDALASITQDRASYLAEVEALQAQSSALAEEIRRQQAAAAAGVASPAALAGPGGVSGGQLGWPVSGPVTSGYGPRWGRLHEGIDIAVAEGTTVVAAGSGVVIYTGWLGGYGNLVVVDHGGELATAYAHNSSIIVSVGQSVSAGQALAASGNTGNSSGPHVHFEVRVNGSAVDPLGYL